MNMRVLVGTLILVGAGLQAVAHFVPNRGSSIWDYNHDTFRAFVYTSHLTLSVIALMVAAILVFVTASRAFAAFAAGVAAMSAVIWVQIAFAEWLADYGSAVAWNGVVGLLGAVVAGVGAVAGWTIGFDARLGATASPGWYADPSGPGQRWWDGTAWTTHTTP